MDLVLREGSRGLSLLVDLTMDRLLVPLAICVSLIGSCLIAYELSQLVEMSTQTSYQI